MLSGFHSAVMDVRDFDTGVRDYARLLGRAPGWIGSNPQEGHRSALFAVSNMILEIRTSLAVAATGMPGLSAFRLLCDDLEGFVARSALGGSIQARTRHRAQAEGADPAPLDWISARVDPVASRSLAVELISEAEGPWPEWTDPTSDADSADPLSVIRGLDHVVVFSGDVDATRDFYGDGLGIRLALDRRFEQRGVRLVFFRIGGVTIEIGGRLAAPRQPDAADRFGGLAWQVPDMEASQARLRADRFDVSEIRDGNKPGTRVCTVRDPVHDVPTLLIEPLS